MNKIVRLPPSRRSVEVRSATFDDGDNSIEIVWTTGAKVRRRDWQSGVYYDEELVVSNKAIRLDRLNGGAPFLDTHDDWSLQSVIGSVVPGSARIVDGQGVARVKLSVAPEHEGIVANIKAGVIRNISVGYRNHKIEKTEPGDDGGVALWRVVDWEPLEISAVPVPADPGAYVRSEPTEADCEIIETSEAQERAANDAARADAIRSIGATVNNATLAEYHVARGTSVAEFRSIALDYAADQEAPPVSSHARSQMGESDHEKRALGVANALLHRSNPTVELTVEGRNFRGMSLLEIGRDLLEARGVNTRGKSKLEVAEMALQQRSGGMMTTSDFGGILSNVANVRLRDAYTAAPQTFRPLVRVASVPDFKAVTRVQLGEAPALNKVNEHGEFKRGSLGEGKESYKIATYGKIVGITRQVIVNDDLDAFSRIPAAFGVQAAQLESDLVWAQIIGNPTMGDGVALFHANHGNLAGSGAAPGLTPLSNARTAFSIQTGLDGKTVLGLTPRYIIVPVALLTSTEQFLAPIVPAQTSNAVPESLRRLTVISEPRLDVGINRPEDDIVVAGSATAWYLAGDTAQGDIVELAYLDGQQGIYTETRTGFDIDGVEIKARLDVGAKVIDHRNVYRNPGA